jgi:hypothetical protein
VTNTSHGVVCNIFTSSVDCFARDHANALKLEQRLFGTKQNYWMVIGDHDPDGILHGPSFN